MIGLTRKLAACFKDLRNPLFVEHRVTTLVMQRVVDGLCTIDEMAHHTRYERVSPQLSEGTVNGQDASH